MVPGRFSFFQPPTSCLKKTYKWTKIGHDVRLGYSLLTKVMGFTPYSSAGHLSYVLPVISLMCSLSNQDRSRDNRALFWAIVNGFQCGIPQLSDSIPLTMGAYSLDCYFSYLNDQSRVIEKDERLICSLVKRIVIQYSETLYSALVLGVISSHLFNQNKIGLLLFFISLLTKLPYLTYDNQNFSYSSVLNAMLMSFSPVGVFFASKDDYSLIFGVLMTTSAIYFMSETLDVKSQCDQESQTDDGLQVDAVYLSPV